MGLAEKRLSVAAKLTQIYRRNFRIAGQYVAGISGLYEGVRFETYICPVPGPSTARGLRLSCVKEQVASYVALP